MEHLCAWTPIGEKQWIIFHTADLYDLQIVGCSIAVESQTKALTGASPMLHPVI